MLLVAFALTGIISANAQITFRATAPSTVVKGEQFRLSYTLNKEGKDIRLPANMDGFEVLFGPSVSTSYSQQTINGKTTSESSVSYTYILMPSKVGSYSLEPASITVDGSKYRSNSVDIKVIEASQVPKSQSSPGGSGSAAGDPSVKSTDAFIRAIVSKSNVYEQEGFIVTFRLYTTLNVTDYGKIEFPEFEGFMVEEVAIPANQQLKIENYNGKNYYTADLRKTLLFPQRSGKMTIPSGRIEIVFSVPSGRKVESFFGAHELNVDVKKGLVTNPATINVTALPANKPDNFTGAVGSFTFKPSISADKLKANESLTITLNIEGSGNIKLIKNPVIEFPSNFENYDPTITNNVSVTTNGLTGTRTISYLTIPRYEGSYTIPAIEFSYFDLQSKSYKTLKSPEYTLEVAKGDPGSSNSSSYVNQQSVQVEQDIRFIKLKEPSFHSKSNYFVGSGGYWLWYLIPLVLFIVLSFINKKQARENANIALMRTKRANKMAIKRLKAANKYLKEHNKEKFYDEILRALWGYFSDKLSIPVAQLTKDNIETELSTYGLNEDIIGKFIHILNTCEFARYAPAESNAAMDNVYKDTVEAIGKMESQLKIKNGKV